MRPAEFKSARKSLNLTQDEWGRWLGYSGKHVKQLIHKMESGARGDIPPKVAELTRAFLGGHRPEGIEPGAGHAPNSMPQPTNGDD